jgi:hypothetical protein
LSEVACVENTKLESSKPVGSGTLFENLCSTRMSTHKSFILLKKNEEVRDASPLINFNQIGK